MARGDLPALFDAFAEDRDGEGWTYLPHGPFDGAEDFAADMAPRIGGDDPIFFTIRAEGRPVGHAAYLRIDPGSAAVEVGFIHYAPALQRRPAATEAMALMMARAFETGYRRYEWKCDALNAPSRRAAERLGFTYEGTFRQATHYKGRNRDTAWFSILDREWPARRVRLAAWLDPANFDAEGRQRARL
ncbi:GNAT family N-acetyltransferase [Wenxinia saemankumensis]|uniref:GNAT family N-acetyltransferase n=1 Tax=Wenxinia saemankumensis TaxID=1447782 RepID=UPI000ABED7FF|nr:GNAT family protein [Wenxinia saemankumensis]